MVLDNSVGMAQDMFSWLLNIVNWGASLFEWANTKISPLWFDFTPLEVLGMVGIGALVLVMGCTVLQLVKPW